MQTLQFWMILELSSNINKSTYLAMVEVFSQTLAPSAYSTIRTMVNFLLAVVVPELADVAIVASCLCPAILTVLGCLLRCAACHAEHVLCF